MDKNVQHVLDTSDDSHQNVAFSQRNWEMSDDKLNIELLSFDDGIMQNKYMYNDLLDVYLVKYPFKNWSTVGKELDMYA